MNNLEKAVSALKSASSMKSNKKIIVLAGNSIEFSDYVYGNTLPNNKFIFASTSESIMGIEAEDVVEIGSFHTREDYHSLRNLAHSRIRS